MYDIYLLTKAGDQASTPSNLSTAHQDSALCLQSTALYKYGTETGGNWAADMEHRAGADAHTDGDEAKLWVIFVHSRPARSVHSVQGKAGQPCCVRVHLPRGHSISTLYQLLGAR